MVSLNSTTTGRFSPQKVHINANELFQKVTTDTDHRRATYNQFCLDVKRMQFEVDGEFDSVASENALYTWIVNMFADEAIGLWFVYWCTQTALAPVYYNQFMLLNTRHYHPPEQSTGTTNENENKNENKNKNENENDPSEPISQCVFRSVEMDADDFTCHLIDGGRQTAELYTSGGHHVMGRVPGNHVSPNRCYSPYQERMSMRNKHHVRAKCPNDFDEWTVECMDSDSDSAILHVTKPFRVLFYESSSHTYTQMCRYTLHVWVPGNSDALGTYDVLWQQESH